MTNKKELSAANIQTMAVVDAMSSQHPSQEAILAAFDKTDNGYIGHPLINTAFGSPDMQIRSQFNNKNVNFYAKGGTYATKHLAEYYYAKTGFTIVVDHLRYIMHLDSTLSRHLFKSDEYFHQMITKPEHSSVIAFSDAAGVIKQIRLANPISMLDPEKGPTSLRYITMTHPENEGPANRYTHVPAYRGDRLAVVNETVPGNVLVITEGMTKAFAISQLGYDAVSVPGVTMWQDFAEDFKANRNKKWAKFSKLIIAFDSDAKSNPAVQKQIDKMVLHFDASVSTWDDVKDAEGKTPKGFDDLCLALGSDKEKCRKILTYSKPTYFNCEIKDRMNKHAYAYKYVVQEIEGLARVNDLFFIGRKQYSREQIGAIIFDKCQDLFVKDLHEDKATGKTWYSHVYPYRDQDRKQVVDFILGKIYVEPMAIDSVYLANGVYRNGVFEEGVAHPQSSELSYVAGLEEPTELIQFLKECHGSLDYRYWLRGLFDSSIAYGAFLAVDGLSGSGKSITLLIASLLMERLNNDLPSLGDMNTIEQISKLTGFRSLQSSDNKALPEDMTSIYKLTGGEAVGIRKLYAKEAESYKFKSRLSFASVQPLVPYAGDDGYDRRVKRLTCTYSENVDYGKLVALLHDPEYLERVLAWALAADKTECDKFFDITPVKLSASQYAQSHRSTEVSQFIDRIGCIDDSADASPQDVSAEEVLDYFNKHVKRNGNIKLSLERFADLLRPIGVEIQTTQINRTENGGFTTRVRTLSVKIHRVAYALIKLQQPLLAIDAGYFDQLNWAASQTIE